MYFNNEGILVKDLTGCMHLFRGRYHFPSIHRYHNRKTDHDPVFTKFISILHSDCCSV